MSSSPLSGVTDTVTEVWSKNAGVVHDLAATAAGFATDVAGAAVEQLEELPDRFVGLAAAAKERIVPPPQRSSFKPWVLLAAAIVAFVITAQFLRRRRAAARAVDIGPAGRPNPGPGATDRARSAAGR